jgi:hypothetical protein
MSGRAHVQSNGKVTASRRNSSKLKRQNNRWPQRARRLAVIEIDINEIFVESESETEGERQSPCQQSHCAV